MHSPAPDVAFGLPSSAKPARRLFRCLTALAAYVALLATLTARPAAAIDIQVNYDETDRPSFDPTGEKLMAMMDSVKVYYEHLLTDSSPDWRPVVDIEVWWDDLPDGNGRLAETQFSGFEIDIVFDTKMLEPNREYYVLVRADARPRSNQSLWPWSGTASGFARFTFIPN